MTTLNLNDNYLMELKLHGIKQNLPRRVKEAQSESLSHYDFLGLCLHDELECRKNSRIERLVRNATFRKNASIEGLDFSAPRGLDKKQISDLASCRFVQEGLNILILGPTGVGKSYLATALGFSACRHSRSALFFRMNTLIEKLSIARAGATYLNLLKRLSSADVLILDDFGLKPLTPQLYQDLYDILDERYETKSTIITTQLPEENWSEVIDDPVTCEAITRRVCEKAVRIQMRGEPYVKKKQKALTTSDPS